MRPDHHGSGVDHAAADAKARKPIRKWFVRVLLVGLLVAALLVALMPTLLSSGPGTAWVVSLVNERSPGEVAVEDLKLSWLGGQRIEGITYDDAARGQRVEIESVNAESVSLLSLLTGSRALGKIAVGEMTIAVGQPDASRRDAGDRPSADPSQPREPLRLPPNLSGALEFAGVTATIETPGGQPIVLRSRGDRVAFTDIRDIAFSFQSELQQGDATGTITLTGNVLNLFNPEGLEQFGEAAYSLRFRVEDVATSAVDQLAYRFAGVAADRVRQILGEGDVYIGATVEGTLDRLASDLTVKAPKLNVSLTQRAEGDTLIASAESFARLDLDQAGFSALFPDSGLTLHKPTQVRLGSIEMMLPIVDRSVDWDTATASAQLRAGDNLAVVDERGEILGINDLRVVASSASIADQISVKLTTELSAVDRDSNPTSEEVEVDLIVRSPLEPTREIDFFSDDLPIALADALAGQEGRLVLWLGEMLALQADLRGKVVTDDVGRSRVVHQFALRPEGRVTGTVAGSFSQGRFTIATPENEPVEATLTPEAFASLMELLSGTPGEPVLTIDRDLPVFLTLRGPSQQPVSVTTRRDKLGLEGFFPDPDRTTLGATIELSPATVFDPRLDTTYELRGGTLSLSAPDLRGKTRVRAELDLWVRPDAGQQGVASLLTWETTVTDLLNSEGRVPLDGETLMQQINASGAASMQNAPSGLLDAILNRDGDLASVLGPIVQNMNAAFTYSDGQPTGASVRLNWDDEANLPMRDAWASMKPATFDIDDEQMLTVRGGQDLEIEVRVSEAFGDRWMGKLHPILFDAKSGDRPVKVTIDGKSFRFPLQGDQMQGSRVDATVDLGTIEFGDQALLGKLMQWTKRPGERAIFEPAKVSLLDGNISYDTFDLAVGNVKLRLDGEVDLVSGEIVDMAVRVPGDSLIRVFNELDGVIKPDDYLSIPMTGDIRKPTFDPKRIGREVAGLVTRGLLEEQKDDLRDLIRKGIGGDDDPQPNQPSPNGEKPGEDPEQEIADELLDRGLDLLFRRLGKDRGNDEPKGEDR
jgi:hypothetical protein